MTMSWYATAFCITGEGNPLTGGFPHNNVFFMLSLYSAEQAVEQTVELSVIWDGMLLL